MKIKVVIFNHDQKESADELFVTLNPHFDLAFFDSGSRTDQISSFSTHKFENLFWTGCWNKAWELFPDYDAIWGIGGDCQLRSEPEEFKRAIQSASPFGVWSPAICGYAEDYMKVVSAEVLTVKYVEGIAFAISGSLWQALGPFDRSNYIGWGQDVVRSYQSTQMHMLNIIDGRVTLFHPPSDRYSADAARILMAACIRKTFGQNWRTVLASLTASLSVDTNTIDSRVLAK